MTKIGERIPDYEQIRDIFLNYEGSTEYDTKYKPVNRQAVVDMLVSYDFDAGRVNSALDRIEKARKEAEAKKRQRSLDSWF